MQAKNRVRAGWIATALVVAIGILAPASALAANVDLALTKSDSADPVARGAVLAYNLTVSNAGPGTATGVQVVDRLPRRVELRSATATQGACRPDRRRVTCTLGELAPGASARVEIRVMPRKNGRLSNRAVVSTIDSDLRPANNRDTEKTRVAGEYSSAPPRCGGKVPTIVGTRGDDTLVGTAKRDVIIGLPGNDSIDGLGGRDIICGFGGNDTIVGRGSNDRLRGSGGDDTLRGSGAQDNLRGGTGSDLLRGGTDDDKLRGIGGDDELRGIGGLDVLRGGGGSDRLRGGGGQDACRGGRGRDNRRSC